MKRRTNAVYTGQRKHGAVVESDDRANVVMFYDYLNHRLRDDDEIEIIPLEQVHPTHSLQDQLFIMADYCVRKIVPEVISMYAWGAKETPRLRALKPIVDKETAKTAYHVAYDIWAANHDAEETIFPAHAALKDILHYDNESIRYVADVVYYSLATVIQAGDEAAYDRIIDLTNEMLESL